LWLAKAYFSTIKIIKGHSKMTVTRVQKILQNQILYKIEESDIKVNGIGIEVQLDDSNSEKENITAVTTLRVFGCLLG
jgi:hypothetical protein